MSESSSSEPPELPHICFLPRFSGGLWPRGPVPVLRCHLRWERLIYGLLRPRNQRQVPGTDRGLLQDREEVIHEVGAGGRSWRSPKMVLPPQGRGTAVTVLLWTWILPAQTLPSLPKSLSTTRCSRGTTSARGMGPRNQHQAGTKSVLEAKTCGCGQETSHILSAAATQAAPEPPGSGWSRVNSCSRAGTLSVCSCKNKAVLPPSARRCLGLQRGKLQGDGRGEAGRDCDWGITAPCSLPCGSRVLKDFKKDRARFFFYFFL